jgi:transposase
VAPAGLAQDKKKARRNQATIVFFDETGFSFLAPLGRTWAPRGKRPVVRRVTRERRVLSTAIGLTLSGKIYKRHFDGSIDSDAVIETLQHVGRHLRGRWILVWDRSPTHTSKKTTAYLAEHSEIDVEWLPPYAPEINPEEYCHGNVKQNIKNALPSDKREMRRMVDRGFARLRRRPDLILGFFHHAGLSVKRLWLN